MISAPVPARRGSGVVAAAVLAARDPVAVSALLAGRGAGSSLSSGACVLGGAIPEARASGAAVTVGLGWSAALGGAEESVREARSASGTAVQRPVAARPQAATNRQTARRPKVTRNLRLSRTGRCTEGASGLGAPSEPFASQTPHQPLSSSPVNVRHTGAFSLGENYLYLWL